MNNDDAGQDHMNESVTAKYFKKTLKSKRHIPQTTTNKTRKKKSNIQKHDEIYEQNIKNSEEHQRFCLYFNKQKRKFLRQKLNQHFGKNFPVDYKDQYNFREQWKNNITFQSNKLHAVYSQTTLQIILAIITILVFSLTIWMNTLIHFFQAQAHEFSWSNQVYLIGVIVQTFNLALKVSRIKIERQSFVDKAIKVLTIVRIEVIILPYFIARLAVDDQTESIPMKIFQWVVWLLLYREASKKYDSLRLTSFSLHYQYQTKLLDMIIKIFIAAHFISIVIYSCIGYDPANNWMSSLEIDKADPFTNYNYAFYFTVTTIMTVGYGDITPKNRLEVLVVSFIEIFGIIMFGFMLNQIGYCISSLRKKREVIDRDLFVVQKLRRHYGMDQELTAKVRAYLVDAKPDPDQVLPEQQQGILLKLNQEIREDLTRHNMAAVVRSSIFFICRWTRRFQDAVSRSLVHTIANPNDVLYQPQGKERIYIIRSGKVHIFAERTGSKRELKIPLKTIESSIKKKISDNCYGYTAVFSSKPTKIYAISKNFTSCYYIQKSTFVQLLDHFPFDFQYYHQIKNRIDTAKICQSFEVPNLQDSKHHYNPSTTILIKKQNSSNPGNINERQFFCRNERRIQIQVHDPIQAKQWSSRSNEFESRNELVQNSQADTLHNNNNLNSLIKNDLLAFLTERDFKANLHHHFESSKNFKNYFKKFNLQVLLAKRDNSFFITSNRYDLKNQFAIQICRENSKGKVNINNFI